MSAWEKNMEEKVEALEVGSARQTEDLGRWKKMALDLVVQIAELKSVLKLSSEEKPEPCQLHKYNSEFPYWECGICGYHSFAHTDTIIKDTEQKLIVEFLADIKDAPYDIEEVIEKWEERVRGATRKEARSK